MDSDEMAVKQADMLIKQIELALQRGDKATARELLPDVLKSNPTADLYYMAARVATSREQATKFLQQAIKIDPYHDKANTMMERLDDTQAFRPASKPRSYFEAQTRQLLYTYAELFTSYGWKMTAETPEMMRFEKQRGVGKKTAIALSLLLNVVGFIIVLAMIARSKLETVSIETQQDGSVLVKGEDWEKVVRSPYELTWYAKSIDGLNIGRGLMVGSMAVAMSAAFIFVAYLMASGGLQIALPIF
jgi:hypothetical protein